MHAEESDFSKTVFPFFLQKNYKDLSINRRSHSFLKQVTRIGDTLTARLNELHINSNLLCLIRS